MGQKFFGVDIQSEVANAFSGEVRTGTLHKKTAGTRTPGTLTGGTNPTEVAHNFDGFLEYKEVRREGEVSGSIRNVVTIIAGSLNSGATAPEAGDAITIESLRFVITDLVERDPAEAVYECVVE